MKMPEDLSYSTTQSYGKQMSMHLVKAAGKRRSDLNDLNHSDTVSSNNGDLGAIYQGVKHSGLNVLSGIKDYNI